MRWAKGAPIVQVVIIIIIIIIIIIEDHLREETSPPSFRRLGRKTVSFQNHAYPLNQIFLVVTLTLCRSDAQAQTTTAM